MLKFKIIKFKTLNQFGMNKVLINYYIIQIRKI
mgnify:CR=1 FL=1